MRTRSSDAVPPVGPHAGGATHLVDLHPDHPGFKDEVYRRRRNEIARLALEYREPEPIPHIAYTDQEQDVWRTVWKNLGPLLERSASRAYLESSNVVRLDRSRVPQLAEVNEILTRCTLFRMLPVAGLVDARTFLEYLGRDVFLATQYMRHPSTPLYTPEPDVVHELVGHAASLSHPDIVAMNRAFGQAALRTQDDARLSQLINLYWYTVEFGVVKEAGVNKAWGAGLLSSFGELGRFETHANLLPFELDRAAATSFDPTQYQATLFVADDFRTLCREVISWLERF